MVSAPEKLKGLLRAAWLLGRVLAVWLLYPLSASAVTLWSNPGGMLICNTGPGQDILRGALHRDDSAGDTLYFKFRVSPLSDSTNEEYFAGLELFEGDTERLGIGNALTAYAYSAFFTSRVSAHGSSATGYLDLRSSEPSLAARAAEYEFPEHRRERTIIFKVQFVAGGDDLVTVWLHPDLSVGATEVYQPESLTTRFSANASFDEIRLRHGGGGAGWIFSDLAIATSLNDFVDPSGAVASDLESGSFFIQKGFEFDTWFREPGMPNFGIRAMTQTRDGFVWLAGEDQLSRFDGVRFSALRSRVATGGGSVQSLFGDSTGALWIGTLDRGLTRFAGGEFESLNLRDGLPSNTVTAFAESKEGLIWVGTAGGLAVWEKGKLRKAPETKQIDGRHISALFADRNGSLWIGVAGEGVFHLDPSGSLLKLAEPFSGKLMQNPQCLCVDQQGQLWIGTAEGLILRKDARGWQRFRISGQANGPRIQALSADPDGIVWVASSNEGLFHIRGDRINRLDVEVPLPDHPVSSLLVDGSGNVWIAGGAGFSRVRKSQVFSMGSAVGLARAPVGSLVEVRPGVIWALQPELGLLRWEGSGFRLLNVSGLQAHTALGSMLVGSDGACWLASTNGLMLCRDPQAIADESQVLNLPSLRISSLAEDQSGAVWAGTFEGQLWQLRHGRWQLRANLGPNCGISALEPDSAGRVWVGTAGKGLYLVGESIEAHWNMTNGPVHNSVYTLHRDTNSNLWIGTGGGGLALLAGSQLASWSLTAGLPASHIFEILEDKAGCLWLHDAAGLTCIRKPSSTDKRITVLASHSFTGIAKDGILSDGGDIFPKGCTTRSGRLWFATREGVLVVEPLSRAEARYPVKVEEVLVDGISVTMQEKPNLPRSQAINGNAPSALKLGPGRHRLEVRYTLPCFENPEKLRLRYKMEGLDQDWVEAGTSRTAQYNVVPPGDYRFIVAAYEGTTLSKAVLSLSVAPRLWERGWVLAASSGLLLAVVAGGARFVERRRVKKRMVRLKREHTLERERRRIAQDLHDEMGARLCRISFLSEHANRLNSGSTELGEHIRSIAGESRDLLNSLDEIVWAVNPQNDNLEHMASYIAQYAENYFQMTGVACELHVPNAFPAVTISSQTRHHFFLAVHESLTNVLKHSGATAVTLRIRCEESRFCIQVEDNGKGFAPLSTQDKSPADAGNGLRNMRQRMEEIGGECLVESGPSGTRVRFQLQLQPEHIEIP